MRARIAHPDTMRKVTLYCLTSYLLSAHKDKAAFGWMDILDTAKGYYSEFDDAKQLGSPISAYYSFGLVYTRDFVNGKVLVNPTTSSYTLLVRITKL